MNFNKLGGLEKQTNLIVNALIKKGFQINFVTTKPKSTDSLMENISFHFMKRWPIFSFFRILFFNKQATDWVKKNKPDIILGIDRTSSQTHIRAGNGVHRAYLKNRKIYFGLFDYLLNKINPLHYLVLKIEKKAFQNPLLKKIIVNSNMVKAEIIEYYKVDPCKIEVIYNGVEWQKNEKSFLSGFKDRLEIAKKIKIDPAKFNLLFVGNGYKRKGLDRILIAASKIKNDNYHISIVGKDKNINKYKRYAAKLGLNSKTTFFGPQSTLEMFYQLSDALILPSYYDPFANAALEALSMGLLTITSKENGAHEIIDENNGIIIKDLNNIDEIKQSIEKAILKKKSQQQAQKIRDSVKHLDVSGYLDKIISTLTSHE